MANIGGAPDDKEQQCGDSECHGRLGKEDSKQMQTGGGTAAKEGGDEGDNERDGLPSNHWILPRLRVYGCTETARPGLCDSRVFAEGWALATRRSLYNVDRSSG